MIVNTKWSLHEFIRQNITGWWQQTFCFQKFVNPAMFCLITPSNLFPQNFEFSLKMKVMGSKPGYLLKSFLLYFDKAYLVYSGSFKSSFDSISVSWVFLTNLSSFLSSQILHRGLSFRVKHSTIMTNDAKP